MTPRFWGEGTAPDGALPATDRAVLWGQGLFETTRLWRARAWLWTAHLDRLSRSAAALDLPLPAGDWRGRVTRGLNAIAPAVGFGRVRLTLTAGDAGEDGDPATPPSGPPRLLLQVWPAATPSADAVPIRAARILPVGPPRACGADGLSGHKTIAWFERLDALRRARAAGADEALQTTPEGLLLGASRANVFLVREGALLTPPLAGGTLPGITRTLVISTLAPALGVPVRDTRVALADARHAEATFLTNALWGVRPATWGTSSEGATAHALVLRLARAAHEHMVADCRAAG